LAVIIDPKMAACKKSARSVARRPRKSCATLLFWREKGCTFVLGRARIQILRKAIG
jgi:hypothetical protein